VGWRPAAFHRNFGIVTDSSQHCSACHKPLAPDDRFCPRCGTPVAGNADPEATLVKPVQSGVAGNADPEATLVKPVQSGRANPEPLSARRTSSAFTDRLHQALGAEYEIIALTGQGGFARVYRARHKRLGRIVAIKALKAEFLEVEDLVERFRAEGIALAKLRHPGIVPIFDIRERDGLIYYVMPFVDGTTLESRLEHRLPPLEVRRILSELTDALAAAHRAQMIHLDIKPANVFLEGERGKVLLMDFGIAKAMTDHVSGKAPIAGTPEYMSPEQAQGRAGIDHRSDIYSLGALGYRMLVGRPPFRGSRVTQTLAKQVNEAPTPIREINPTVPKDFADAIMRCLAKDPAQRFATALELRAALDAVTFFADAGAPVHKARGPSPVLVFALAFVLGLLLGMVLG
jgi:serine/threonine-protein kinase